MAFSVEYALNILDKTISHINRVGSKRTNEREEKKNKRQNIECRKKRTSQQKREQTTPVAHNNKIHLTLI